MIQGEKKKTYAMACVFVLAGICLLSQLMFAIFCQDHIMDSDIAAEVLLSNLMAQHHEVVFSSHWYYSTELRVLYTQLIMTPLFHIFHDFATVKIISVVVLDIAMAAVYYFVSSRLFSSKTIQFMTFALFLMPLSKEYFDMLFVGNFYSFQVMTMFLLVLFFAKQMEEKETTKTNWAMVVFVCVFSFVLGLSGLRYLEAIFVPVCMAIFFLFEGEIKEWWLIKKGALAILLTGCAGVGFLVNKFVLSKMYTFDQNTQAICFVPLDEVPQRLLWSFEILVEFFGYHHEVGATSAMGLANIVHFAFMLCSILVVYKVFAMRKQLSRVYRFLLYYFLSLFFLNWYLLVFSDIGVECRYWIPIYIILILIYGIYFAHQGDSKKASFILCITCCVGVILAALYGNLWQYVKHNESAKRYDYVQFLEEEGYTFGYASFWHAEVTEYLTNGEVQVAPIGSNSTGSGPYKWLCDKDYYKPGFYEGKSFMLLTKEEEMMYQSGMISMMQDGIKVYEDEEFVIYQGEDMYLFE